MSFTYMQKNHSNLISNLRAMNEPLSTVTELPASAAESSEDSKEEVPVLPRSRKKGTVELNPPNIHIEPPPPSSKVSRGGHVTCLTSDICLTADPEVASSILARSHTFVEIDHENNFYGHSPPYR